MDELRGPTIQIVLHVNEGLGFGFLRTPFIVSGSLNGYMLETDSVVPCHAPVFDAELVWEADKRKFRSLRIQNVPIKVEVFTTSTQGRKDKVGYLLLSLLGAQPCPTNKIVDIKHSWHRLLGVRSEGKCCQPQLQLSLSVEDRVHTMSPRNELRMFHSNEIAYPTYSGTNPPTGRSMLLTLQEYLSESKKTVTSPELQPRLLGDEGLIQIGDGKQLFTLSLVIGDVENLDLLLPEHDKEPVECYVTYTIFTHDVMTDRVAASGPASGVGSCAHFNQRTSLRVRASLAALARYFAQCPHLVARLCDSHKDIGISSLDLRKLVPSEDLDQFLTTFCNADQALTIHERCFLLRCDEKVEPRVEGRRAYVDVEMSLKYVGLKEDNVQKPNPLTARSVPQLESVRREPLQQALDCRSGSCTHLDRDVGGVAYTNMGTDRYKNASGDAALQTNEIADLIKKMCDSFAVSQERLLASRMRPPTCDMQVQCEPAGGEMGEREEMRGEGLKTFHSEAKLETSKSDTCITHNDKKLSETVKLSLSSTDRDSIMQKVVDELEDWKERQQELFKCQLKRKEDYHLELLSKEWSKKRVELESRLSGGVEQCRRLADELGRATDEFRRRGRRNTERETKLLEAKKALEAHYTAKYQELRDASQKMEADMNHQVRLKDMRVEELETRVQHLDKQVEMLKNNLKNNEKKSENRYSGLTKDQTASLIQELRCLEEKLDSAVQSKAFFKEQWGRAVRELHLVKLGARRMVMTRLRHDRRQLGEMGLDPIEDHEELRSQDDLKKRKDDFYVDILANTPALHSNSMISTSGPDGMEMYEELKNAPRTPMNERLTELISQREALIQQDSPDEGALNQLSHEIRAMLLNCGT